MATMPRVLGNSARTMTRPHPARSLRLFSGERRSENPSMDRHTPKTATPCPKVLPDTARLRHIAYELTRAHVQLRLPLIRLADAGRNLAANPVSSDVRSKAHEAWTEMLQVVDLALAHQTDEELLEHTERLRLVPDVVAEGMLGVCNRLKELESQISQVDFQQSSAELLAQAGEAMRELAAALNDLTLREDRDLLPAVRRLLYQHGVALKF